jgi:hypothetical protein
MKKIIICVSLFFLTFSAYSLTFINGKNAGQNPSEEDIFLIRLHLTDDSLDHLITSTTKLGLTSLMAIYDVDGNLLNKTELIEELKSISKTMTIEERAQMNHILNDLPNRPTFSFDNVGLKFEVAPVVAGATSIETARPGAAPDKPTGPAPVVAGAPPTPEGT